MTAGKPGNIPSPSPNPDRVFPPLSKSRFYFPSRRRPVLRVTTESFGRHYRCRRRRRRHGVFPKGETNDITYCGGIFRSTHTYVVVHGFGYFFHIFFCFLNLCLLAGAFRRCLGRRTVSGGRGGGTSREIADGRAQHGAGEPESTGGGTGV